MLIKYFAALPESTERTSRKGKGHGGDLWIPHVVQGYWQSRPDSVLELEDRHFQPFYDAAWELCRIGVLRPGEFAPRGWVTDASLFSGDTFSITKFGRVWLKDAGVRPIVDPSRLAPVLMHWQRDPDLAGLRDRAKEEFDKPPAHSLLIPP